MKKISFIITVLLMVVSVFQCRRPNLQTQDDNGNIIVGETQFITVSVSSGDNVKVDPQEGNNTLLIKWEKGDKLYAYCSESGSFEKDGKFGGALDLVDGVGDVLGVFEGEIKNYPQSENGKIRFYSIPEVDNNGNAEILLLKQSGTLEGLSSIIVGYPTEDFNTYGVKYFKDVELKVPFAIMKFDLSFFTEKGDCDVSIDYVRNKIVGEQTERQISYKGVTISEKGVMSGVEFENTDLIKVKVTEADSVRYVAFMPGEEIVMRFEGQPIGHQKRSDSRMFNIKENTFYTQRDSIEEYKPIKIVDWVDFGTDYYYSNLAGTQFGPYPIAWGKFNIGVGEGMGHFNNTSVSIEECEDSWYGDYYAWGDTLYYYLDHSYARTADLGYPNNWKKTSNHGYAPKSHYRLYDTIAGDFKKYTFDDGRDKLNSKNSPDYDPEYDPVNDDYCSTVEERDWFMPTMDDWQKLWDAGVWMWINDYYNIKNLNGYIIYKPKESGTYAQTDEHIFLPAAGYYDHYLIEKYMGRRLVCFRTEGRYDSRTRDNLSFDKRVYQLFNWNKPQSTDTFFRFGGCTVRPVRVVNR